MPSLHGFPFGEAFPGCSRDTCIAFRPVFCSSPAFPTLEAPPFFGVCRSRSLCSQVLAMLCESRCAFSVFRVSLRLSVDGVSVRFPFSSGIHRFCLFPRRIQRSFRDSLKNSRPWKFRRPDVRSSRCPVFGSSLALPWRHRVSLGLVLHACFCLVF